MTGGALALASLAPTNAVSAQQLISPLTPLPVEPQAQALAQHHQTFYRSETTRSSDSAHALLRRLGVDDDAALEFFRSDAQVRNALLGRAGRNVTAEVDENRRLTKLVARWLIDDGAQFKRLVVTRNTTQRFHSYLEVAALTPSVRAASGTIRSSLFAAADDARVPDAVAVQLAEIFAGDIDFHRSLRRGDRFSVVYEVQHADGEPLRSGRVLSAQFVNNGKAYQALWFQEPGEGNKGGYYTPDGQSLRRAYLASPLEFSRVTSGFKMRFHPILQTWRAHLGVDYAAPTGTPVRSVGDGVVDFAGRQNGYGNVVHIKHRNQHSTVYAHLSRLGVQRGQKVAQGQIIGAVGATGWATGPHLHFEFRVDGVHHDPLTIAKQSETVPISAAARPAFERTAQTLKTQLAAAALVQYPGAE